MKKSIALLALSATLLVIGCQQGLDKFEDHFKEYSFKYEATRKEEEAIHDGVYKNALYLSSCETIEQAYHKSSFIESSGARKTKITIKEDSSYPNSLITEVVESTKENRTEYGISYRDNSESMVTSFHHGSYLYKTIEISENDKTTKSKSATSVSESFIAYRDSYLKSLVSLSTDGMAKYYVCSDNSYAIVFSYLSKKVSAVQWGDKTKEYIVSQKDQYALFISKDFKLTSSYSYSEAKTNYDSITGEWFDSEQLFKRLYSSTKYNYDKRKNASINSLVSAYNNFQTK